MPAYQRPRNWPTGRELLAVVPAYNEAGRVAAVVEGLLRLPLPVLVVDDGSRDGTGAEAQAAGASVITQPNGGKGRAILSGCRWAVEHQFGAVILLDGDGQHDPAEAPDLVKAWQRGAGLVIGKRTRNCGTQPLRRLCCNRLSSLLVTLASGQRISDSQSGFRLCDPRLLLRLPFSGCRYDLETEMCVLAARAGERVIETAITTIYNDKVSGMRPIDSLRFFRAVLNSLVLSRRRTMPRRVESSLSPAPGVLSA